MFTQILSLEEFTNDIQNYFDLDYNKMMNQKSETLLIAKLYRIVRPLFQVNNYFYAQVCSLKDGFKLMPAAIFAYDNEEPTQSLRMLTEKFEFSSHPLPNLIFPHSHVSDSTYDRKLALFLFDCYPLPLSRLETPLAMEQLLEILHSSISCLSSLHSREIVHGRISPNTGYLIKKKEQQPEQIEKHNISANQCRFALNILDTSCFSGEQGPRCAEQFLFQSEGQALGLKVSYKDDLESLVYLMAHLLSRGTLLTLRRYQLEWLSEQELLRWKNADFFKEMVKLVPDELSFLIQLYTMVKALERYEKPDYTKIIKKITLIIASRKKQGFKEGHKNQITLQQDGSKSNSISIENKIKQKKEAQKESTDSQEEFMNRTKFQDPNDCDSKWESESINTQSKEQSYTVDNREIVLKINEDGAADQKTMHQLSNRMKKLGHHRAKKSKFKEI